MADVMPATAAAVELMGYERVGEAVGATAGLRRCQGLQLRVSVAKPSDQVDQLVVQSDEPRTQSAREQACTHMGARTGTCTRAAISGAPAHTDSGFIGGGHTGRVSAT